MTRTARATFPRAVNKDRSISNSGHRDDKHMRKDGGGPHGWGRLSDEKDLEEAAMQDEVDASDSEGATVSPRRRASSVASNMSTSSAETEFVQARKFRKNALKAVGELDLTAIARTSAAAMSPISPTSATAGGLARSVSR